MDLLQFSTKKKSNAGEFLQLKHPKTFEDLFDGVNEKGEPDESKPVGLYLLGVDSDVAVQARHKRLNAQVGKKSSKAKTKDDEDFAQKSEAEQNEILADCTVGWANLSLDGNSEFSRETILKIYSDSGWAWLREQAMMFVNDRGNFI